MDEEYMQGKPGEVLCEDCDKPTTSIDGVCNDCKKKRREYPDDCYNPHDDKNYKMGNLVLFRVTNDR